MRRQPDAASIGRLLELGGARGLIRDDGLLPFVQAVGQDEMATTLAAIDDAARLVPDRGDVLGADVPLRVDPHSSDTGGSKIVFSEKFVARWFPMSAARRS
jgi:hypothetical protein